MKSLSAALLITASVMAMPAWAAEPAVRAIPKVYLSPGASGSIETYQRSQSHDVRGGYAVPSAAAGHDSSSYGGSIQQQRGAIRQSTEYPGGLEVERVPGRSQYQENKSP
ncbi:MAG: hypothetical protein ACRERY_19060 [Pseudomonas sp.]